MWLHSTWMKRIIWNTNASSYIGDAFLTGRLNKLFTARACTTLWYPAMAWTGMGAEFQNWCIPVLFHWLPWFPPPPLSLSLSFFIFIHEGGPLPGSLPSPLLRPDLAHNGKAGALSVRPIAKVEVLPQTLSSAGPMTPVPPRPSVTMPTHSVMVSPSSQINIKKL